MFLSWLGRLALSSVLVLPTAAGATTLKLSPQGASVFGSNGQANVVIQTTPGSERWVRAGGFALTDATTPGGGVLGAITAWCADIGTTLKLPSLYEITAAPFAGRPLGTGPLAQIEALFETSYKTLNLGAASQSAGFQLALWELLYETGGSYDLGAGSFKASHNAGAVAFGQSLLAGLSGPITQSYSLTFLQSDDPRNGRDGHYSQHLLTVAPVPLPAAGWLMALGLGGLLATRRRRGDRPVVS
jgi:hypothetical protein